MNGEMMQVTYDERRVQGINRRGKRVAVGMAAAALFATAVLPVRAQQAPAPSSPPRPADPQQVSIVARDQPVGAFLTDLFGRVGQPVVPSSGLTGTVSGTFNGPVDKVFRDIAKAFNLVGYYDGAALYVYSANELTVRTLPVGPAVAQRVLAQVRAQRLGDARNIVRAAGDGNLVASGTPRFIEQVTAISQGGTAPPAPGLTRAAPRANGGTTPLEFRVFYLRYARADDTLISAGGREVRIPGLATTMQNLVLDQRPGGSALGGTTQFGARLVRQSQPRLKGSGLDAVPPNILQTPLLGMPTPGQFPGQSDVLGYGGGSDVVAPLTQDVVRIEPNPYLNAVIVRDVPERMASYDSLIRALDVEPQLVEVEATIIDVDTDKARSLGINWRFSSGGFGALFGNGTDSDTRLLPSGPTRRGNVDNITPSGIGGTISTIIGSQREFLARITALETKGVTRVISRPQLMTLSNVEAVFDRTRTFYVRVAGREEVDLFNVTAGTVMRVNPHVFRDHDQTRIRVLVNIEDGSISNDRVQGIPVVDRATVATQAMVLDGESLLLGGMTIDEDTDMEYKIPLLGDIPVLGNLFKSKSKRRGHIERLFLITPRVASLSSRLNPATVINNALTPGTPATPAARLPLPKEGTK
jgi:type III secretion protein C